MFMSLNSFTMKTYFIIINLMNLFDIKMLVLFSIEVVKVETILTHWKVRIVSFFTERVLANMPMYCNRTNTLLGDRLNDL